MKHIASLILLAAFAMAAQAEQMFVSDKLIVSVYAEANQDSEKIDQLESGAALEVIEKAEGYTHVHLANGRDGWIKSSYLSSQTPAIVRVKELEKERASSTNTIPAQAAAELKQLQEQNSALRTEVDTLKKAAATVRTKQATETKPSTQVIKFDTPSLLQALEWGAAIAVAGGITGFAIGYGMISQRIKRKYGKLKIY
ncbi:MAG TPA: TIGR04211 family SH3 domain-containing protein [Steroidobacteraceae bacterium]|nr:TIGR04211 family SH3 domain-containing protein [Steroidobacteraceae bacterium]